MNTTFTGTRITFPEFTGIRCLMMPFIQGDPDSVSAEYQPYADILERVFAEPGDIGYLTIDESVAVSGKPHRGTRATTNRALHTEVGRIPGMDYVWGGGGWSTAHRTVLERDTPILLANNLDDSCAVWDATHENTSHDGDIGHCAAMYPYENAEMMKAGDVHRIGILTPHESLPARIDFKRQFLRIIGRGVHGTEPYFTRNPLLN
jgi:hypothetical protein